MVPLAVQQQLGPTGQECGITIAADHDGNSADGGPTCPDMQNAWSRAGSCAADRLTPVSSSQQHAPQPVSGLVWLLHMRLSTTDSVF